MGLVESKRDSVTSEAQLGEALVEGSAQGIAQTIAAGVEYIRPFVAVAAALLMSCAGPPRQSATPLYESVMLEQAGDAGVHMYRIPAMTVARDGTVVIAFDARNKSKDDLPGDIDVVVRRSSSMGRTWSTAQRVVDFDGDIGGGDASLLTDRDTGRIFLFYTYAPPGVGVFQSNADRDSTSVRTQHPHVIWSDDNGRTWEGPRNLIAEIKPEGARGMFATSGHGIQLSEHSPAPSRLLQPYAWLDGEGAMHAGNAYSDDHGRTWRMSPSIGAGLDESKAVELADGRVMQNIRPFRDGTSRLVAMSRDGGITFDAPVPDETLVDPRNNADIIRVHPDTATDSREAQMLLFSNTANAGKRVDLTVRLSCDSGRTWPVAKVLHPGPAMYSTMVRLPDGTFGILYENGVDGGMTFARFSLAWLDGNC